ncbi:MAG: tetratricopeptide repeat protein [Cyclobacteriaceae bacterium]
MKYPFSLLCFLFTVVLYAQSPEREAIDERNRVAYELLRTNRQLAFDKAQETYTQSLSIDYDKGQLWAKIISANYLYNANQLDTAQALLEKCLAGEYEAQPIEEFGLAYLYLGRVYRRRRDFSEADLIYEKALKAIEGIDKPYLEGTILSDLGVTQGMQGNYPAALDYFVQSYEIKAAAELPFQQYTAELINIAMVYNRMGEHDKALEYAQLVLANDMAVGDTVGITKTYNTIGGIYTYKDQNDSALHYYGLAIQWARWANEVQSESIGLLNQAEIYHVQDQYQTSLDLLEQALRLVSIPYPISPTEAIFRMMAKNYNAMENSDSALHYSYKAMSMAQEAGINETLMEVYQGLYTQYLDLGNKDSALHYLGLYHAFKDSIYGEKKNNEYTQLRIKLETTEKEKEIAILEADKKVNELQTRNLIMGSLCAGLLALTIIVVLVYRRKRQQQRIQLLEADMQQARDQLTRQTLHMIHMNNGLDQVEQDIKSLNSLDDSGRVSKVISKINVNKALDKEWENFTTYFNRVNTGFLDQLTQTSRDLSNNELRMCALLKMRLSNHEIATILNIEAKSVRMAKYRLKKKLAISEELDLGEYLQSLN